MLCDLGLTHTVTHTPKCPERDRERQTGSSAFLSGFFAGFFALNDLRHEISHRLRRLILLLPGGVGVGVQRERCFCVAQDSSQSLGVHPAGQGMG